MKFAIGSPPLAEDIGAETKEFGLAVRPSHAGTKRSRDETSDEDDGSYAYLSPKQTPIDSISGQTSLDRLARLCLTIHKQHQLKIAGILTMDHDAISPSLLIDLLHFFLRMSPHVHTHAHTFVLFQCAGSQPPAPRSPPGANRQVGWVP